MVKKLFILSLLLINIKDLFSQTGNLIKIAFEIDKEIKQEDVNTTFFFEAKNSYLQVSCSGLNDIELSDGITKIPYYEKNKSSKNIDFLYENLVPGKTYYLQFKPSYFEKNNAQVSIINMENKITQNRVSRNVRPFQHAKVMENKNSKQIKY